MWGLIIMLQYRKLAFRYMGFFKASTYLVQRVQIYERLNRVQLSV